MATPFTFKIEGLAALQSKFKKLPARLSGLVEGELEDGARAIEQGAKNDAPANEGFLRNKISSFKVGSLTFEVVSMADYSAYVEFGTRSRRKVPAELEQFAAQFKGGGSKGNAKQAIYEWCRLKGIEEKFWWSIYISVMTKGIHPQPFFFKNFLEVRPKVIENVKRVIAKL